jgi:dTDP-L-rhamnose 4-epimerase
MKALVTGGAGFIGSHLTDGLLADGIDVRILDNLDPQVHGAARRPPAYLNPGAELQIGDVRDPAAVASALADVDVVFHHAAAVGVAQSMYEIERFVSVNSLGAAILLQEIAKRRDRIRKIIVASSMSIYGEGAYRNQEGDTVFPGPRPIAQLEAHAWDPVDSSARALEPVPTPESKPLHPTSVYAITKRDHEELFLVTGAAYGIPTVALRYFNTYGPRQALSNPYTGLLAIVCSQLLNHHKPLVFEDGMQMRDFVHVSDVVRANLLVLKSDGAADKAYNVGAGRPATVLEVIALLSNRFNARQAPEISARYRAGDIRHCFADIASIQADMGYQPQVTLERGIDDLIPWIESQRSEDHVRTALSDLERRALMH